MLNKIKSILSLARATSVNNFINLCLNQGINVIVALIATPLLYQKLGEEKYGLVNLSLSIVMLFGIIVGYGFNTNAPKRLALILDKPKKQSTLINEIVVTRVLLSIATTLLVLLAIYGFGFFQGYASILSLSLILLLAEAVFPMFILQGFDKLSWLAISNGIIKLAFLTGLIVVIRSPSDAIWVNLILGVGTLITNFALLIAIYVKRDLEYRWIGLLRFWLRLKDNFYFFSYTLAAYILVNGGFILLNSFVSESELGRYSLAQRVAFLLRTVPAFLTQSILQKASRLHENNKAEFDQYLSKTFKNGLLLTFGIGVIFAISSSWVIRVLSGEYVPYSANVLRILCFLPFVAMLNLDNMIRILVAERKQVLSRAMWVTTTIMLILACLGSFYYGGYGLAVAMIISETLNFVIHRVFLLRALR